MHPGADVEALAVQLHPAALRAVGLDIPAGRTGGLVADEQDVGALVLDQRLQVIHHAAAGAHAAGGDHDAGMAAGLDVVQRREVLAVIAHRVELLKTQRVPPGPHPLECLDIPEWLELAIDPGEVGCQR